MELNINTVLHREMLELILGYIHPDIAACVCHAWRDLRLPEWNISLTSYCAGNGYIGLLEWAKEMGTPYDYHANVAAAGNGRIDVLEYLDAFYPRGEFGDLCTAATQNNHLNTLKWLERHGYTWNIKTWMAAIGNGSIRMIEYLRDNDCPCGIGLTCKIAAKHGRLDVLIWAIRNGYFTKFLERGTYSQEINEWLEVNVYQKK